MTGVADILASGDNLGYGGDIERKLRAKVALGLLQQGSSAAPVQHWTQGLARLAQALSGGVMAGQIGADEARDEADTAARLTNLPGLGGSGPAAPPVSGPAMAPRPRMAAALSGVPDEPPAAPTPYTLNPGMAPRDSQDTFRTPTDAMRPSQDAIRAAYAAAGGSPVMPAMSNPTPAGAVPVQTQAIAPPAPQVAQARSPTAGAPTASTITPNQIDPQTAQYIKGLLANKKTQKYGEQLYQHFLTKSKDMVTQETDENGNPVQRVVGTGEIKAHPSSNPDLNVARAMRANPTLYGFKGPDDPALDEAIRKRTSGQTQSISIQNVAEPVIEGLGKQFVASREKAQGAATEIIPAIHEARAALDNGAVTGLFAGGRLDLTKAAGLFGMDTSKAANTEVFRAAAGQQVLSHAKALGANPSNTDRDYIEKVQGGQIALEEGSIRRLLDMQEKWARQAIQRHNISGNALIKSAPEGTYRGVAPLMLIDEPPEYQKSAPAAGAGGRVRTYNPATGKIE